MAELIAGSVENQVEPTTLVRKYIKGTHGSLPMIDYDEIASLLSDSFVLTNEEQR